VLRVAEAAWHQVPKARTCSTGTLARKSWSPVHGKTTMTWPDFKPEQAGYPVRVTNEGNIDTNYTNFHERDFCPQNTEHTEKKGRINANWRE
jgi:hypothetical protein